MSWKWKNFDLFDVLLPMANKAAGLNAEVYWYAEKNQKY